MARRGRKGGIPVKLRGGAAVISTGDGMQARPKHGRKNRGLTGRSRKVRRVGSGRM